MQCEPRGWEVDLLVAGVCVRAGERLVLNLGVLCSCLMPRPSGVFPAFLKATWAWVTAGVSGCEMPWLWVSFSKYRQNSLYCPLMYCASQAFFKKQTNWRFVSTLCQASLSAPFFPNSIYSKSLCHILVILAIFQTFSHYFYLWWWSVISDIWCYVFTVMGATSHTNVRAWT